MPCYLVDSKTTMIIQSSCGENRTFNTENAKKIWLKLHNKKCDSCQFVCKKKNFTTEFIIKEEKKM